MGPGWLGVIAIVAAVTMTYGNFAALAQRNFKRMLAYSSIAHAGYMLVGVAAAERLDAGREAAGAVLSTWWSTRSQCRGLRGGRLAGPRQEDRRHRRPERPGLPVAAPGDLHPRPHALADRHSPVRRLFW